jgi:ATP-dependent helicase YprA (DUF1998 family)
MDALVPLYWVYSLHSCDETQRRLAFKELSDSTVTSTILEMALPELKVLTTQVTRVQLPGTAFLGKLSVSIAADVHRAVLLIYLRSLGKIIPRDFQLETLAESLLGRDGLITAATGSGKTLIMIMIALIRPKAFSLVIVPLKRLQQTQAQAFTRYGISAVIINEDTPDDPQLWKVLYTIRNCTHSSV